MTEGTDTLVGKLQAEIARLKDENHKLRASNRRWMRIAGTDSLTGLPNKVFFTTALLPQAISEANAEGMPLGCVMMAPDKLGDINAEFGRKGGDEVVKGIGKFLSESVEENEKLVHMDGANFVLMVPNADLVKTKRRSLTLRARVLNRQFDTGSTQVHLTLSLGVVSRASSIEGATPAVKEIVEEFLRRLETALDQAKGMGGDRPFEDPEISF
ncbi:MAG: GGDEF domain-containing protein [Candidatus Latescibacterota bacterium]|nr:GGDEF domain-containing protein [Candidatus Latescibacterota bacterium]